jgi:outer membrane immunogenic protein
MLGTVQCSTHWSGKKGTTNDIPPYPPTESNETRENWLSTDRVRVGFAANNWFLYATAGVAVAGLRYTITNPIIVGGSASQTHTVAGWTAGAGIEWAIDRSWSFKAEYLFVDFGGTPFFNFDGLIPTTNGSSIPNRSGGVFLNDNIVRVGVNYRFGTAAAVVTKY